MNSFLQSKQWADFQKSLGRKVWKINNVLVIKHNLPFRKNYLYSPHCEGDFLSDSFLKQAERIAKKNNSIFLRIEPVKIDKDLVKKLKLEKSTNLQFQKTLVLDITKPEQELLKQMHSKTRYNIKLAEKKGIKIKKHKKYFKDFRRLLRETAKKAGFHTHLKKHYKKLLDIPGVELFAAFYRKKVIAANIIVFYNKQAIYLHGASDYEHRNLMAPHLLQWHQILEAKKRNCTKYDFWGIDEKKYTGVTRFKRGFNGKEIEYPNAYDLAFRPLWYLIYKITKKIL